VRGSFLAEMNFTKIAQLLGVFSAYHLRGAKTENLSNSKVFQKQCLVLTVFDAYQLEGYFKRSISKFLLFDNYSHKFEEF
jgi:hypothetical protein